MIQFRKIAAVSALGLSMSMALLGTGVASAHNGPTVAIGIRNSHHVNVSVTQRVGEEGGYGYGGGCGCGYGGYGYGYPAYYAIYTPFYGGFGYGGFGYGGFGYGGWGW